MDVKKKCTSIKKWFIIIIESMSKVNTNLSKMQFLY
jgi:hypothetical protein